MSGTRTRAVGQARAWTDAQLDALAQITPADLEDAAVWWDTNAEPEWRRLLDSQPTNEGTDTGVSS